MFSYRCCPPQFTSMLLMNTSKTKNHVRFHAHDIFYQFLERRTGPLSEGIICWPMVIATASTFSKNRFATINLNQQTKFSIRSPEHQDKKVVKVNVLVCEPKTWLPQLPTMMRRRMRRRTKKTQWRQRRKKGNRAKQRTKIGQIPRSGKNTALESFEQFISILRELCFLPCFFLMPVFSSSFLWGGTRWSSLHFSQFYGFTFERRNKDLSLFIVFLAQNGLIHVSESESIRLGWWWAVGKVFFKNKRDFFQMSMTV